MAEDLRKQKMLNLASTKKTTVESAFDSDESDWSDEDGENTSVVHQINAETNKSLYTNNSSASPIKSAAHQSEQESRQRIYDASSIEDKSVPEIKDNKVKTARIDEDDDWDEESCTVKIETIQPHDTVNKSKDLFFQPASGFSKHAAAGRKYSIEKRKNSMIDWSETFSEGGASAIEDIEIENFENLPVDNEKLEPQSVVKNKVSLEWKEETEMVSDKRKSISSNAGEDKLEQQSTPKTPVSISNSIEVFHNIQKQAASAAASIKTPSPAASATKTDFTDGSSDNLVSSYPDNSKHASNNTLPSSSSAAQLFCVAPTSSPHSIKAEPLNIGSATLTASTPNLVEATKSKKQKSKKPSSAKQLLSRFFSSDNESTSKRNNEGNREGTGTFSVRKTSEPIPLSTLLLKTPIEVSNPQMSENKAVVETIPQDEIAGAAHVLPTRYFPPALYDKQDDASMRTNESNEPSVPKKRKGFLGKMKKTLGISSKGSKMRASESLKNLQTPTTALSDPCISSGNQARLDGISVQTDGRPAEDVIVDLLKQGRVYLESARHSYPYSGGGDAVSPTKTYEQREPTTSAQVDSRFSSSEKILTKSNNSLVEAVAESDHRMSRDPKMSSYYCSQAIPHTPNRQVIYNLIEDFCCVLDKSFGEHDRLKSDNGNLFSEIDQLRGALECCEAGKTELERQLQEMQAELQKLQFCLEEECQTRASLECIVCELKAQMERQDDILNNLLAEKADLLAGLKQLETDNWNLKNQIADLGAERDEFSKTFRGFEGTKNKCSELQQALAECCEKHDVMQKEILDLRNENNEIKLKLDNCVFEKNKAINDILQNEVFGLRAENNEMRMKLDNSEFEKNKLLNDIESMKQAFAAEKTGLEAKICELLDGIAALEKSKGEICKQTNTMLAAHHEEMDNLKAEADDFKAKYEHELKIREELEHRLRATGNNNNSSAEPLRTPRMTSPSPPFPTRAHSSVSYQRPSSEPSSSMPSSIRPTRDTSITHQPRTF